MFKPSTLKIASYISLVCCLLGVLLLLFTLTYNNGYQIYLMLISWALLLYCSFLGIKLSGYELYDEDRKRLGYCLYGVMLLFVLFILFNFSLGLLPAIFITITLHNQKKGFDTWMKEKEGL
ncbi:hypothetical protein ACFQZI_19730 [Mucilaginibacter lutimaris]|uniref:Uncharacterized protein n=1 Tax=Mucilaginibacter lutimaris TaxID=931629 RepID=A0ABW2ZLL6_9SPHI